MISKERKKQIRYIVSMYFNYLTYMERSLPIMIHNLPSAIGNCVLIPYSIHMEKFELSYEDMITFTNSYDACTDYHAGMDRYIIFYNDIDKTRMQSNRYRWNIAHELGHICLKHLVTYNQTRVYRSSLTRSTYKLLEDEADCFAAYMLVPHVGLYASHIKTQRELMNICKISSAAASTRYNDYIKWYKRNDHPKKWDNHDKALSRTYSIAGARKHCSLCNYMLYDNFAKYCPICGNSLNYTLEEKMARYPGVELNKNNRPEKCFECDNEENLVDSKFCMICGKMMINTCTNKEQCNHVGEAFPGNARFCPYCGKKTTYYEKGYLKQYNKNDAIVDDVTNVAFNAITDDDIPF